MVGFVRRSRRFAVGISKRAALRRFRAVEVKKDVFSKIRHWCARAERSAAQVRRKLYTWGESAQADALIQQLVADGFLDEQRFAAAFAMDHIRIKGWGPAKVLAALRHEHQLDDLTISNAMAAIEEGDVLEAARRAARKRRLGREDEPAADTVGALLSRGFDLATAQAAVAAVAGEDVPRKFGATW